MFLFPTSGVFSSSTSLRRSIFLHSNSYTGLFGIMNLTLNGLLCSMDAPLVNINFESLSQSLQKCVREKAKRAGSTIVYKKGDSLIEEDPSTLQQKVLKRYTYGNR